MPFVFIDLLKALAAGLITNSHLANVWPVSAIASGGMLGNVIFFAVSGYCLSMPKDTQGGYLRRFFPWYGKRIRRIYLSVWLVEILIWISAGQFPSGGEMIQYFVFPTRYHFIASIMILYIVFYLVRYVMERWRVPLWAITMVYIAGVLLFYLLVYDRSYAHVDVVEEPFIRCLFFGAMLMGFYFRQKESRPAKYLVKTAVMLFFTAFYFASKIIVSHYAALHDIQILTWVTILAALYFIFDWAQRLEPLLREKMPVWLKKPIHYIAALTLQIYLVQFTVIGMFEHLAFPLNLVVILIGIILAAWILQWVDRKIQGILPGKRARIHTDN